MRKIEKQMIEAIERNAAYWGNSNTHVKTYTQGETGNPYGTRSEVYLHNNLIAEVWTKDGQQTLEVNTATLARWPSVTTKSRLRALGANVTTKKGRTYLDGILIA